MELLERCLLCGEPSSNSAFFAEKDRYRVVRCRQCGLVYLNPRNNPESVLKFYAEDVKSPADYFESAAELDREIMNERLELAGWVRNLTNEVYKTQAFDASTSAGLVGNLVGLPRTYGLSVDVKF